jgi:hypothetical protein
MNRPGFHSQDRASLVDDLGNREPPCEILSFSNIIFSSVFREDVSITSLNYDCH